MFSSERDAGTISELAMSATSLVEFEQACFSYVRPLVGFDTACSVWSSHAGAVLNVSALGYSPAQLEREFPRYMGELSPAELLGFAAKRPTLDVNVLTRRRRERLAVYRELLDPLRISQFVTNVWHSRLGVFGFHFARTRPAKRFRTAQLARLEQIVPSMKLGQALLSSLERATRASELGWNAAWGLSAREREVATLVARGFHNAEIASLLRISANTVRNHLVWIFHKVDVSTRAELVFVMMSSDPTGNARCSSAPWSTALTARAIERHAR